MTTAEQTANAQQILAAAQSLGLSPADTTKADVIGLMTAIDESGLHVYTSADEPVQEGSSRGLFQQLVGWGPETVREDPYQSALLFYKGGQQGQMGLLGDQGWQNKDPWVAAEDVQQSATPGGTNYQAVYQRALDLFAQLGGQAGAASLPPASFYPVGATPGGTQPSSPNPTPTGSTNSAPPEQLPAWEQFFVTASGQQNLNPAAKAGQNAINNITEWAGVLTKLLTDLISPSFWLRVLSGLGGIILVVTAGYMIATST